MIGIAKTGSGKTAAFLWPMLVHIMDQRQLLKGEGPIGLVLVPTRELALQIYTEAKKFGKVYDISVVCAYGGGSKWEQSKALEQVKSYLQKRENMTAGSLIKQSGAATCFEGFEKCLWGVSRAVGLYCSCHAVQASKVNLQNKLPPQTVCH